MNNLKKWIWEHDLDFLDLIRHCPWCGTPLIEQYTVRECRNMKCERNNIIKT